MSCLLALVTYLLLRWTFSLCVRIPAIIAFSFWSLISYPVYSTYVCTVYRSDLSFYLIFSRQSFATFSEMTYSFVVITFPPKCRTSVFCVSISTVFITFLCFFPGIRRSSPFSLSFTPESLCWVVNSGPDFPFRSVSVRSIFRSIR